MTTLKCKCRSFEASFASAPCLTFICQCHSCVSAVKGIEAKESFSGISMKSDAATGGAAVAIFKSKDIAVTKVDAEKIGFMKVGEDGIIVRRYCTECGTIIFNEMNKNWSGVSRNALINADGSTPFICSPVAPMNIMVNDSFDKDLVPGPRHGALPLAMIAKFIPLLLGLVGEGMNVKELIPEDISMVESVPITWACTTNPLRSILLRVHHIIRD